MDWLEHKYLTLVSSRLDKFTRKSSSSYNFRCPVCGDSKKNKSKARGWIFDKGGKTRFYCHNCSASMSLIAFIKFIDQSLYQEFKLERMKELGTGHKQDVEAFFNKMKKPIFRKEGPLATLTKVSQLAYHDPIKKYVESRKIPTNFHHLFACPDFFRFINTLIPGKFPVDREGLKDETRLLIPFINADGKVHALQGRSMDSAIKKGIKYITIVLDDSIPKIYGLDTLKGNEITYVLEGPIDAMFIPNSIATAGGDLISAVRELKKDNLVIVYDNERRSNETIDKLYKAINSNFRVCIWPDEMVYKDINDMILAGMTSTQIKNLIDENTHTGLRAMMEFNRWKRVGNLKTKKYFMRG